MKPLKKISIILRQIGFDPFEALLFLRGLPRYIFLCFKLYSNSHGWAIRFFPILTDRYKRAGSINSQYFIQDLYFAKKILRSKPTRHLDIGSRVDGFVSHLLVFMDVEVLDIRPLESNIQGLVFRQFDIISKENIKHIGRYPSVSCLHTIEHFGLGRYGDKYDLDGWAKGLSNILELIEHEGLFYLSTPIGFRRIEFNAHRIFDPKEIISFVCNQGFSLVSFEYLDDNNKIESKVEVDFFKITYGCGFFIFKKHI